MRYLNALLIAVAVAMTGCSTSGLTGLGADSTFSCKAPSGVACMSVSGISANASSGNLPALRKAQQEVNGGAGMDATDASAANAGGSFGSGEGGSKSAPVAYLGKDAMASPRDMEVPYSGMPLRSPPKVARIWIAPSTDSDQDLHDQRFVYVTVHTGKWMLEANSLAIERQFRPVYQLGGKKNTENEGSAGRKVSQRQATQNAIETVAPSTPIDQE